MCSGRSRKPQKGVRPSVRPSIHFSSANQICVFLFSANRKSPLIPGGRFDWLCDLKIYPGVTTDFKPRVQARWGTKMGRSLVVMQEVFKALALVVCCECAVLCCVRLCLCLNFIFLFYCTHLYLFSIMHICFCFRILHFCICVMRCACVRVA